MTINEISVKYNIPIDTLRYYEKIGVIPPVNRTKGNIRNYNEEDESWVKHTICMRKAGLDLDTLSKYVKLYGEGDNTFKERLALLQEQREKLIQKKKEIQESLDHLDYKIKMYEEAVKEGKLIWK